MLCLQFCSIVYNFSIVLDCFIKKYQPSYPEYLIRDYKCYNYATYIRGGSKGVFGGLETPLSICAYSKVSALINYFIGTI